MKSVIIISLKVPKSYKIIGFNTQMAQAIRGFNSKMIIPETSTWRLRGDTPRHDTDKPLRSGSLTRFSPSPWEPGKTMGKFPVCDSLLEDHIIYLRVFMFFFNRLNILFQLFGSYHICSFWKHDQLALSSLPPSRNAPATPQRTFILRWFRLFFHHRLIQKGMMIAFAMNPYHWMAMIWLWGYDDVDMIITIIILMISRQTIPCIYISYSMYWEMLEHRKIALYIEKRWKKHRMSLVQHVSNLLAQRTTSQL